MIIESHTIVRNNIEGFLLLYPVFPVVMSCETVTQHLNQDIDIDVDKRRNSSLTARVLRVGFNLLLPASTPSLAPATTHVFFIVYLCHFKKVI